MKCFAAEECLSPMPPSPPAERGLAMSGPMIRSYFAGMKGETRRLLKQQPVWLESAESRRRLKPGTLFACPDMMPTSDERNLVLGIQESICARRFLGMRDYVKKFSPYGQPGDELYFKEHWRTLSTFDKLAPSLIATNEPVFYEATLPDTMLGKFRQGRFMCRWMSRFRHIPILDIRVERLRDISEDDAMAEGVEPVRYHDGKGGFVDHTSGPYRKGFERIWCDIHGFESWLTNPWVWVIEFKKHNPS